MQPWKVYHVVIFIVANISMLNCKKEPDFPSNKQEVITIPAGFPQLNFPVGNEFTQQRWALGKRLFYDPILSLSNSVSCASCHNPQHAFSDTLSVSLGDNFVKGRSNAPTLTNVAYHPYYTRAGGVPTLEMQILVPIQEHDEFNTNILDIVEKLKKDSSYVQQAREAYNREFDPYVLTRSIANFERSLVSGNSAYDQYAFQSNPYALNAAQLRGHQLFIGDKTNCSQCHSGFNFTNYAFENNGLYIAYADSGRMRLTRNEQDRARFKVPTLRNIEMTAPYMHDGSMKTLKDVVAHYNAGGFYHKNKSLLIKPIGLTKSEQEDLVSFLLSLTDHKFIQNKKLQNEN